MPTPPVGEGRDGQAGRRGVDEAVTSIELQKSAIVSTLLGEMPDSLQRMATWGRLLEMKAQDEKDTLLESPW
jgi:hypothetical protein